MDTIGSLGGMLNIPQWFVWRLTWNQEDNKFDKVPCYPDGSRFRMDASDPANHMPFAAARDTLAALRARSDGFTYTLGFWLTASTGYWFLDIDKCLTNGQLSPLAQTLFNMFPGAAYEWSSSNAGLHIFGRGDVPLHRRKDAHGFNLEFYTDKRGIAFGLSGQFYGAADTDHSTAVAQLVAAYFPPNALHAGDILDSQFDAPCAAWSGPNDDDELIALIRSRAKHDAASVFAGAAPQRATFSDLFDGNRAVLDHVYAGQSDMDYALIGVLSFWTGRDAIRTERIMRRSALYRDKWESQRGKDTYIRYSILRQFRQAHIENREVYGARRVVADPVCDVVNVGCGDTDSIPTVTVTINERGRAAVLAAQDAFNGAHDPFELEAIARACAKHPDLEDGAREGLAHDLMRRFEQLQSKRKITQCRTMLRDADAVPAQSVKLAELTEFGNVQRVIARFGSTLMHVSETDEWYRWDNSRWQPMVPGHIENIVQSVINGIREEAETAVHDEQRAELIKWWRDSQKATMVKNVVSLCKFDPSIAAPVATLDTHPGLLGVRNGMVDLSTGALLAPDRFKRITQSCSVEYVPTADCPWFKQTVREAFFNDMEMVLFFKRLMGYALMANPKHNYLVIPYGHGANGKSTIMNAIASVMGDYSRTASADTFTSPDATARGNAGGPREDLVRLRGARLLTISEIDENAHLREAMVKSLVGGDTIIARGVNARKSIEYVPQFVPVMSTNHRPIIKNGDTGIWRRILMIPFERNFREDTALTEDKDRAAKIAAEREGVLRWLVEGALDYQTNGISDLPQRVREAVEDYKQDMDLLAPWIERCLVFEEGVSTSNTDMFKSWQTFAERSGVFKKVPSMVSLSRKLAGRKGFVRSRSKHERGYVGVRVKTFAEMKFNG